MTDRGRAALGQTRDTLAIGASRLRWTGSALEVEIDETSSLPHVTRIRGTIRLEPLAVTGVELPLTDDGAHVWRPFAPIARIEVALDLPGWNWAGHGYLDANFGTRALETDFRFWTWSRYPTAHGALCIYDGLRRDGSSFETAISFDRTGTAQLVAAPPPARLSRSLWRVRRETRADPGSRPRQVLAMLDAPFYCRSAVETTIDGERVTGVHEVLDLDRFRSPIVKSLLAFRVPRRGAWPPP